MLAGKPWKIVILSGVGETRFKESVDLTVPVPKEHHSVEDRYSRVADSYYSANRLGDKYSVAMQSVDNSQSSGEYLLLSLLGTCTY